MDCCLEDSLLIRQSTRVDARCSLHGGAPRRLVALIGWLAMGGVLGTTPVATAEDRAGSPQSPNQRAVAWLDRFALEQVLFHDRDVASMREDMVAAPVDKAQQWLDETAELRRQLDSPDWQETRQWLREFLQVQAIYTARELDEFHNRVMAATPAELGKMLQEIETRRSTLVSKANAAALRRQQMMEMNNTSKQQQLAQRQALRRAAGQGADFGTTKNTKVGGKPSYAERSASRGPLVSSFGIARWAIYRSLW